MKTLNAQNTVGIALDTFRQLADENTIAVLHDEILEQSTTIVEQPHIVRILATTTIQYGRYCIIVILLRSCL